mmetsp:Transcript_9180/g.22916  ORF Transcript_9180/g.22916 Transcript_9180/m.22916 type:complete len:83 (-) Transcript_9180:610-858(-)
MRKLHSDCPDVLIYLHYQPSYYHVHCHVTSVASNPTWGAMVGQAHLLEDVLENIETRSDYYQRKTLRYTLGEQHDLLKVLKE